jgi:hypothetical protein
MIKLQVDPKYTIIVPETTEEYEEGRFRALRYGEEWRDLTGDGLVLALVYKILSLQNSS